VKNIDQENKLTDDKYIFEELIDEKEEE